MKIFNNYIRIFVICSIAFMQTSNALATIFSVNSDNYAQICTINGIKTVSIDSFKDSKKYLIKAELMNCCLDTHSNFIISNYNNVDQKYFLDNEIIVFKNIIKSFDYKNKKSIRAPPALA